MSACAILFLQAWQIQSIMSGAAAHSWRLTSRSTIPVVGCVIDRAVCSYLQINHDEFVATV